MKHLMRKLGLLALGIVMLANPAIGVIGSPAPSVAESSVATPAVPDPTGTSTSAGGDPVGASSDTSAVPAPASNNADAVIAAAPIPVGPVTRVVTGPAIDTKYGPFQVEVTVTDGTLTNVVTLQQPTDRRSRSINTRALPGYTQAALTAQSASIDHISGATYTFAGYTQSLQAALDEALA